MNIKYVRCIGGLLVLFAMTACGVPQQGIHIDPQMETYYDSYLQRGADQGVSLNVQNLVMEFNSALPTNVLGECTSYTDGSSNTVDISTQYWAELDDWGREELTSHELGHCIIYRVHRPDENNGLPLSNMNAYFFDPSIYVANFAQYQYEMFHQADLASALPLLWTGNADGIPVTIASGNSETNNADTLAPSVILNPVATPNAIPSPSPQVVKILHFSAKADDLDENSPRPATQAEIVKHHFHCAGDDGS